MSFAATEETRLVRCPHCDTPKKTDPHPYRFWGYDGWYSQFRCMNTACGKMFMDLA